MIKAFSYVKDAIGDNLDTFKEFGGYIATYLAPVIGTVLGGALQVAGKIAGGVIDVIAGVVRILNGLISGAVAGINALISAYNAIPFLPNVSKLSVPKVSVPEISVPSVSTSIPKIPTVSIPKISNSSSGGGVATAAKSASTAAAASSGAQEAGAGPGTSVLAGLGGAALVPLSRGGYRAIRPTQEMKEARALERLQGVYQRILPEEAQRKQVLSQLRLERARGDEDVRLMAGSITNNPAILALQRAAERSSQEVAELKARNIAGVGAKISRGLEEAGAQPSEAEMFFKTKLDGVYAVAKVPPDAVAI
jgi:hypothetical protein